MMSDNDSNLLIRQLLYNKVSNNNNLTKNHHQNPKVGFFKNCQPLSL